jgi:hypothetical protein
MEILDPNVGLTGNREQKERACENYDMQSVLFPEDQRDRQADQHTSPEEYAGNIVIAFVWYVRKKKTEEQETEMSHLDTVAQRQKSW